MPRVTKDPDIRKQEIIDVAIQLFYEKGFEQTSMLDITKKMNVSQGLCYRYFQSKEEIYQAALDQYVSVGVENFKSYICDNTKSILAKLDALMPLEMKNRDNDSYDSFFNKSSNSLFHMQMQIALCNKLCPIVADELSKAQQRNEIAISNPTSVAAFCMFGQLGIWFNANLPNEEKVEQTKALIKQILGL